MKRWVYCNRIVTGDPRQIRRRVLEDLPALLAAAAGDPPREPSGDGSFLVELDARVLGATISKHVRVTCGVATRSADGRSVIPLRWVADPLSHAFPTFEGTVEVEAMSDRSAQITVVGGYIPPAGPLGAVVDAGLHGLAEHAITAITDGLADALADDSVPAIVLDPVPMRVRDVMTADPLTLRDVELLRTAAILLFHHRISGVPVVDHRGALVGVLSEADLLLQEAAPPSGFGLAASRSDRLGAARSVGEAASRPARVTSPDSALRDAAREMLRHDVARLVVVDDARVVGIVTRHDVLRALIRNDAWILDDIQEALAAMDEPDVTATLDGGTATLAGEVSRLSILRGLLDRVRDVDGVLAIESADLRWTLDDVTSLPMM